MIAAGNVPEGFDWREHADFSCLTEAHENLGLEVEPGNLEESHPPAPRRRPRPAAGASRAEA